MDRATTSQSAFGNECNSREWDRRLARRDSCLLRNRVRVRSRRRRATRRHALEGSCRSSLRSRVPRSLPRIHTRFSFSRGSAAKARDAATTCSAQRNSGRLGRDRRKANRNLSAQIARRLECDRPDAAPIVRSKNKSACAFACWRSRPVSLHHARGIRRLDNVNATAIRAGFLTSVQDLGRTGFRELGVSLGGALDAHALRVANLLAGNEESAAGLEITFGGLRLRFIHDRIVVWGGGNFDARIGSTSSPAGHPALVRAGEEFSIGSPKGGCRAWLAISGGIDVPAVLGSRSGDLRGGFGGIKGRPVRDGEEFPLGENSSRAKVLSKKLRTERIARWKPPHEWSSTARRAPVLRYFPGADSAGFVESAFQFFNTHDFLVSPDSDRMGIRLD